MNTLDKKEVDINDYWLIPDNPITKIGRCVERKKEDFLVPPFVKNFI